MQFHRNSGVALLIGSLLMTVTMLLHPAGGSVEHLLKIANVIIISHAMAILAMPVCLVGFFGLTKTIGMERLLSLMALVFVTFGLVAGMLAGAINGLALPIYIMHYREADVATIESIKPILRYGSSLNHAFDYILIGTICLSVVLWSVEIIRTKKLPLWLGYFGIMLALAALVLLVSGFVLVDLRGFRVFVFGLVTWIVCAGVIMYRLPLRE